jgi:hypothetical protein
MLPVGNNDTGKGTLSPKGYIRIKDAIHVIRSMMFSQEMPEALLVAARKNAEELSISADRQLGPKVEARPTESWMDQSSTTLIKAIKSGDVALFAMTENTTHIFAIPKNIVGDVLVRAGLPPTKATIYLRFVDMMPVTLLRDLQVDELQQSASKTFALILKEKEFEDWLSDIAGRDRWPLDKKARKPVGRPDRVSAVKPLVKLFVESGKWRGGDRLKQLTSLINAKLKHQEVSRGTIENALSHLYAETRDLRYRHKKRKRRASPKRN